MSTMGVMISVEHYEAVMTTLAAGAETCSDTRKVLGIIEHYLPADVAAQIFGGPPASPDDKAFADQLALFEAQLAKLQGLMIDYTGRIPERDRV